MVYTIDIQDVVLMNEKCSQHTENIVYTILIYR